MPLVRPAARPPVRLTLARDLTRSLRRGHPWVFADALRDRPAAPAGAVAVLCDKRGRALVQGYYDARSPLAFRACTADGATPPDDAWAAAALEEALALRDLVIDPAATTGYRLVNGEGDGLPGLVCDRYGDTAVLRLDGPTAEAFWDAPGLAAWLAARLGLARVYARERTRDAPTGRALVGPAPDAPVPFREHGLAFTADVAQGQKTGFFLDQRENRERVRRLARDRRVLNVFGYTGGFSVYAAAGGASHVTTVDLAAPALAAAREHFALNGLDASRHDTVAADAFAWLDEAAAAGRRWDLVILDPPSFAPSRKAADKAAGAYRRLVAAGARVTAPGGLLVAASCSSHVSMDAFVGFCEDGVGDARRRGTLLGLHDQPADHPTPLAFRDFRYLKLALLRLDAGGSP